MNLRAKEFNMTWDVFQKMFKNYVVAFIAVITPLLILFELIPFEGIRLASEQAELYLKDDRVFQLLLTGISLWGSFVLGRLQCMRSFGVFSRDRCRRLQTVYTGLRDITNLIVAMNDALDSGDYKEMQMGLGGIFFASGLLRRQLLDCLDVWSDYASEEVRQDCKKFASEEREGMDSDN